MCTLMENKLYCFLIYMYMYFFQLEKEDSKSFKGLLDESEVSIIVQSLIL
jgi:hypothetical protein